MIMALVENAGVDLGINNVASSRKFDSAPKPDSHPRSDLDQPEQNHLGFHMVDQSFQMKVQQYHQQQYQQQQMRESFTSMMHVPPQVQHNLEQGNMQSGYGGHGHGRQRSNGGGADLQRNGEIGESFKQDIRDLEELLSKLNPMAEEFVPPSLTNHGSGGGHFTNNYVMHNNSGNTSRRVGSDWKNNYSQSKRRINNRTSMAQQDEIIRRTVYVSDIDHQVTEEQLAALFVKCGHVVDCRVCGDPNSVLRFAFVEFTDDEGAKNALTLAGTMLGYYPVRVLPSKTAIAPVNPTFLPKSEDEREMCARTIYCTNIDKKVSQADVKLFFESICGEVYRLRLLGDYQHSTRIAFVEFVMAESAIAALNCSGVVLGSLPIRVSPSKTPVRPRAPRPPMH